jgi:hypothetical protein
MQIKGGAFFAVGENISDNEPMRRIPPAMFNATWMFQYNVNW